jgi:hypothetical protein
MSDFEFKGFPKLFRLNREIIISEKIDGTNAQILVSDDGLSLVAGCRTRFLTPEADNFGFAAWVAENRDDLLRLGPGRHFGEWWGAGIQRRYGQSKKRFSLFNTTRWAGATDKPSCCDTVPLLYRGPYAQVEIDRCLDALTKYGSAAALGWKKPEGIVIFHTASGVGFKVTYENDQNGKEGA